MNPFTNRGMVTDSADFIGRAEQMEEICSRLQKMESTSIVGERRIGKSSLLYQLALTDGIASSVWAWICSTRGFISRG